jgi:hypothetical protein
MNKHKEEVLAIQRRVEARIEYEKRRKEKAKEGYQCYLVYMRTRKML